ncbi:MAG TPA: 2-C-methyl-D-erythritol 2,4-cyclodiphosphate synthase [Candidatus Acidoferrales bacterium]|nr:2-C-methyl-D-erythritol 2,4-cyclodiphosphate synthase [Candidatus Acidoferrales bacterium]
MKIGFGFDAHELVENRQLRLGGVVIEFPMGLRGHSDGDVVLHALSDAILGASAKGDIGIYFRDDEKKNEGIDSKQILKFVLKAAAESGLKINNIDIVVVADRPKLNPFYELIRNSISRECEISISDVSVKSKTTEGTAIAKSSIACFAVVLMKEL